MGRVEQYSPDVIAEAIAAVREGQSLAHVARAVGTTPQTVKRWADPQRARRHSPCGTVAAYRRHIRYEETPCTACCEANAAAVREYKWRNSRLVKGFCPMGCGSTLYLDREGVIRCKRSSCSNDERTTEILMTKRKQS